MRLRFLLILACPVIAPLLTSASPSFPGLTYGHAGDRALKLDLYLPAQHTPHAPVVLYIHGGGWRVGSKAEGRMFADRFTQNGIAFASIDYRLSNVAIWPAQIHDCKTAVRWLHANAQHYGLDPSRIGVMGASAGGHLAALLGTTSGVRELEDRSQGSPAASDRVRAVCDVSGPVDMFIPTRSLLGKLSVRGEFGGPAASKPEAVRQADPSLYVKGGEPPFLLIYGEKDGLVTPAHAEKLGNALRSHHNEVTLDLVPGGGHVPLRDEKQRAEMVAFFQKHLSGRK